MQRSDSWTIISLGGSLIVPDQINVQYLRRLKTLLRPSFSRRYVIVCGGGATSRRYISAAKTAGAHLRNDDLDWMGIHSLNLNAELVRLVFGKQAFVRVVRDSREQGVQKSNVIVAGANKPGSSSDLNAVKWAVRLRAKRVINLTNIDFVFSADLRKDKKAKPLAEASWNEYLKIIGTRWTPGRDTPFDPIASKLARQHDIEAAIVNGRNLNAVRGALRGKKFRGTLLHS